MSMPFYMYMSFNNTPKTRIQFTCTGHLLYNPTKWRIARYIYTNINVKQTDRQTDEQTDRQTDKRTDRQTHRENCGMTGKDG